MRIDLSPLYRSTVGFDRLFSLFDEMNGPDQAGGYPPYNIERTSETAYRVTLAVAGFAEDELDVQVRENALTIKGEKKPVEASEGRQLLFQGIAARAFERRFQLADHVQVTGAALENGLLHVNLVREVPEAAKPRQIAIGRAAPSARVIEQQAA